MKAFLIIIGACVAELAVVFVVYLALIGVVQAHPNHTCHKHATVVHCK
jgi:hypothetical protein